MRKYGRPENMVIEKLRSYCTALKEFGADARNKTGRWVNGRAENSRLPFRQREGEMVRSRRMRSLRKFASVQASVAYHLTQERGLSGRRLFRLNRTAALAEWRGLCSG